jgi:hypothetical protein
MERRRIREYWKGIYKKQKKKGKNTMQEIPN